MPVKVGSSRRTPFIRSPGLAQPIFSAPLITTLVAALAAGSGTPTFTRATTAYVTDFEGLLKPVISGEVRFQGARRVANLLLGASTAGQKKSEDISGWGASAVTVTGTDTAAFTNATGSYLYTANVGSGASRVYRIRAEMQGNAGDTINVALTDDGTFAKGGGMVVTLTAAWRVYSCLVTAGVTAEQYDLLFATRAVGGLAAIGVTRSGVQIRKVQVEEVTGQSNTNPSEYVSVGVLSAPYNGANVDGVKYFDTLNGNTVAANVVTEATGAAISAATLLGYRSEGARTNLYLQSQTFDNASWTKGATAVTADGSVAPDGATTADFLQEDGTNAVHIIYQQLTVSSAANIALSVYAKASTRSKLYINYQVSANNWASAVFDLSTGAMSQSAVGATSGTIVSTSIAAAANGFYRCTLVASATGANGFAVIGLAPAASGNTFNTTGGISYAGDNASGLYLWGAQAELGVFASSYIPTTAASVTRNADVLTYPAAGNVVGTVGTAYAEVSLVGSLAAFNGPYLGGTGTGIFMYGSTGTDLRMFDGTTGLAGPSVATMVGTPRKLASSWGPLGLRLTGTGQAPLTAAFDGDMSVGTNITLMNTNASSATHSLGTIRNVRIYARELNIQAMTA